MQCPYCLNLDTKVVDSRPNADTQSVRRRRECEKCDKRFTTYEQLESVDIIISKKDGRREPFSREKGMMRACEKRPIPRERIERAVAEIESTLRQSKKPEIPSKRIGQLVMDQLQQIDEVAYVRFASVYRSFKDAKQFTEEIERLRKAAKI
jgi:transcriptional repressor NrdR